MVRLVVTSIVLPSAFFLWPHIVTFVDPRLWSLVYDLGGRSAIDAVIAFMILFPWVSVAVVVLRLVNRFG